MTTSAAYILIALIIASGSCKEPRLIARTMASLELCQAAANLVTKGGGLSDCVLAPAPDATVARAGRHHWRQKPSNTDAGAEEVQRLNRAQLGDQ